MMDIESKIRENIRTMKPYSSARDEFSGSGSIYLDANENPVNTGINRYPDPHHNALRDRISALKNIPREQIFLGHGSDEPIDLVIRLFCRPANDAILVLDPSYGMYSVAAAVNDIEVVRVPLNPDFTLDSAAVLNAAKENVKIIFLCSPNNPSGNLLSPALVQHIITSFTGIVVLDEAYIDFSSDQGFLPALSRYPNLVILQTFSKAWGLAGLRVGMAFANPLIISYLNRIKPPYNLNTLSQNAVLEALNDAESLPSRIQDIIRERTWLEEQLSSIPAVVTVFPSDSNFLLVKLEDAADLFTYLLEKGIIVRDRSRVTYGEDCLRLTVGLPEENRELVSEIKKYYQ